MAVWDDLVVSGTHDFTPVNTHWRVRLETNRGIRAASLAHRAPDLRGGNGAYVSPAGAPLHPLVAIGSPNCRPGTSSHSAARHAGSCPVAVCIGLGRAPAHIVGMNGIVNSVDHKPKKYFLSPIYRPSAHFSPFVHSGFCILV